MRLMLWLILTAGYTCFVCIQIRINIYITDCAILYRDVGISWFAIDEHIGYLSGVRVTQSLILCVCFVDRCLSFFAIVLSVLLRFTAFDYPFGIFKLLSKLEN